MSEQNQYTPVSSIREDLGTLQKRASYQRQRYRRFNHVVTNVRTWFLSFSDSPIRAIYRLPSRYLLHALIALLVPVALALSQLPAFPRFEADSSPVPFADTPSSVAPTASEQQANSMMMVGDPPLNDQDIPMPISLVSRNEAMAPVVVAATASGESVKLRNGPGMEYDDIGRISRGAPVEVVGRYGEWLQVRYGNDDSHYWVASELLDIPQGAVHTLFEVPSKDIPPPPPPRIGLVREDGLNLRDGPGTNYVPMLKFDAGKELSLVETYNDWVHVVFDDGKDGWVKTDFLHIGEGVMNRVPDAPYIPDPNPPLVGAINENSVNIRKGPGTGYSALGKLNADNQVDLLARHKDWLKVKTADGTEAWVFIDLVNMTPMALRRVPYTNNIPALPVAQVAASRGGGGGGGGGGASGGASTGGGAAYIPASGDVASYALQFVGSRYRMGGASPGSGFDCSGFTQYVYRQYGVYLPHSSAGQYSTAYGAAVGSMNNLAPGDLVFFAGTYRRGISHVAIYIGGGRIVHAMTPSLGVQVSNIWSQYWTSHYYGAIRVRR